MLSTIEKSRVRYFLGYPQLSTGVQLALGVPSSGGQLGFLIEHGMNQLLPAAEPKVREVLAELECIEKALMSVKTRAQASRTGEVYLRASDEIADLEDLFIFWCNSLSDIFSVPINPFSLRHQHLGGAWTVSEPC